MRCMVLWPEAKPCVDGSRARVAGNLRTRDAAITSRACSQTSRSQIVVAVAPRHPHPTHRKAGGSGSRARPAGELPTSRLHHPLLISDSRSPRDPRLHQARWSPRGSIVTLNRYRSRQTSRRRSRPPLRRACRERAQCGADEAAGSGRTPSTMCSRSIAREQRVTSSGARCNELKRSAREPRNVSVGRRRTASSVRLCASRYAHVDVQHRTAGRTSAQFLSVKA